jgi:hypothetical protein
MHDAHDPLHRLRRRLGATVPLWVVNASGRVRQHRRQYVGRCRSECPITMACGRQIQEKNPTQMRKESQRARGRPRR